MIKARELLSDSFYGNRYQILLTSFHLWEKHAIWREYTLRFWEWIYIGRRQKIVVKIISGKHLCFSSIWLVMNEKNVIFFAFPVKRTSPESPYGDDKVGTFLASLSSFQQERLKFGWIISVRALWKILPLMSYLSRAIQWDPAFKKVHFKGMRH